jgi:hypothetical protein
VIPNWATIQQTLQIPLRVVVADMQLILLELEQYLNQIGLQMQEHRGRRQHKINTINFL